MTESKKPKWYFIVRGRLLTVRASTEAMAYRKLRLLQLGMAS